MESVLTYKCVHMCVCAQIVFLAHAVVLLNVLVTSKDINEFVVLNIYTMETHISLEGLSIGKGILPATQATLIY